MEEQYNSTYPRNDINPKDKNLEWGMLYAKAAWNDWNYTIPRTVFYNAADKYEELRLYAIGKQPINKYKKLMGVDEQTNNTFLNLDWSVRPVIPKFRDIAISRLVQQEYNIVATPIDPLAKWELDEVYADMRSKLAIRNMMQQQSPELANHPMLMPQPGEPMDFEELEMRMDFGEQFNRSKDAEMAVQLALYQNGSEEFRRAIFTDLFDLGVAGWKEWLGDDNKPKFRKVNPEAVLTNYCRFADFRDLQHCGEVIDVSLVDLATMKDSEGNALFTEDQLLEMANNVAGKWSNPTMVGRSTNYFKSYDKFKVKVLDMQFYSYNELNWERTTNRRGNLMFNEAPWNKRNNVKDKYLRKRIKVVYEIKWIIGTDYAYDFGLMKNMKRSVDNKKKAETTLGYRFFAPNFYEMRALGMMERLMPLADEYQMNDYRIQNFKARMVPSGWWIDLDALENVSLSKGGQNMKPMDLVQMFMETGVLAGRSKDIMGDNVNYKPIIPIDNTAAAELTALYQDRQLILAQMQSIIGLNELTDGSTPNPKTLNGVAEIAVESTNNSLFPLQFAEKWLMTQLAGDLVMRTKQALRYGNVEGFAPALNTNTLKFMQIDDNISMRDFGIILEERPTTEQRQLLVQSVQTDLSQGLLDTSDVLYVMNMYNVKQAQQMLAYKAKKNRLAKEQADMAKIQQQNEGNAMVAERAEAAKQQTLQMQAQLKLQEINLQMEWQYRIKQLDSTTAQATNQLDNQTKMAGKVLDAQVKQQEQQQAQMQPA